MECKNIKLLLIYKDLCEYFAQHIVLHVFVVLIFIAIGHVLSLKSADYLESSLYCKNYFIIFVRYIMF